jgi:nucleoside-diphosphate-sugar epimerase
MNEAAPKSALITGGAGFIGSHLSELLLAQGWEVFVLDDLSTGSERNVAHLRKRRDFHLIVDSVLKSSVVNELVHRCDVVYHLAAAVGVRLIVEEPVHTLVTNIQGTENVLDHCNRFGKRVLVASTSEVYGDRREPEALTEDSRRMYDGTQTRCFCHVGDTIGGLTGLMDGPTSGDIFNVGSTERVTISELAQRVIDLTDSSSEIVFVPYDQVYGQGIEDMLHRQPSIDKITGAIGWKPKKSLDQILADVVKHTRASPAAVAETA